MSEDSTDSTTEPTISHSPRKTKKDEIFGVPRDDLTLGIAGAAAIGVLGLAAKTAWDMMQNGQLPNPFAPPAPRISYSDVYEQQKAQQEWERQNQQPAQQQPQPVDGGDPNAQTMPALTEYQGFDDTEDGVSYSTTPPKKGGDRYNRINMG